MYICISDIAYPHFLVLLRGRSKGLGSRCLLLPCMFRLLPCIRLLQFMYQATFPCVVYLSYLGDLGESCQLLIGSNRADWRCKFQMELCMGWLCGEIHEECCIWCMLWWMGKWFMGGKTQDGMPGCDIGCKMSPRPKIRCKMELWTRCKQRGARWSAQICFILYTAYQFCTLGNIYKGSISINTLKPFQAYQVGAL